jgi:putative tryptophan/tyrosine transport system substrate-binding protein
MNRRDFITLLGGAAAAWPLAAWAQRSGRMQRIGFISAMAEKDPQGHLNVLAFQKGLLERGLNVSQNLRIHYRFGAVGVETIRTAVADILATSPDVILAHGTAVTAILQKQTQTVPVVFTVVSEPVGSGFIKSFAHPGGNLTGFTNFLEPSIGAKWGRTPPAALMSRSTALIMASAFDLFVNTKSRDSARFPSASGVNIRTTRPLTSHVTPFSSR